MMFPSVEAKVQETKRRWRRTECRSAPSSGSRGETLDKESTSLAGILGSRWQRSDSAGTGKCAGLVIERQGWWASGGLPVVLPTPALPRFAAPLGKPNGGVLQSDRLPRPWISGGCVGQLGHVLGRDWNHGEEMRKAPECRSLRA